MTNSEDLAGLLVRVEKAEGPDRELDRDIIIGVVPGFRVWSRNSVLYVPADEPDHWGFTDEQQTAYREAHKAAGRPLPEGWEAQACKEFGTPWITAEHLPLSLYDGRFASSTKNVNRQYPEHYTTSLDAALALCERVLPGWSPRIAKLCMGEWYADFVPPGNLDAECRTEAKTPALALLGAMLRALIASSIVGEGADAGAEAAG